MKKQSNQLIVYTVYKIHPAKHKIWGTCIWYPIFSCSWRWLALLVHRLVPRTTYDADSTMFPRAEHVEDSCWKTTKEGKLIRTNE